MLPNKLSELLELGLKDLRTFSERPGCKIRMSTWLQKQSELCFACLAGAVMYESLKLKPLEDVYWFDSEYPVDISDKLKLEALNQLRVGRPSTAAYLIRIETNVSNREVLPYSDSPEIWWQQMEQLLKELKENGE